MGNREKTFLSKKSHSAEFGSFITFPTLIRCKTPWPIIIHWRIPFPNLIQYQTRLDFAQNRKVVDSQSESSNTSPKNTRDLSALVEDPSRLPVTYLNTCYFPPLVTCAHSSTIILKNSSCVRFFTDMVHKDVVYFHTYLTADVTSASHYLHSYAGPALSTSEYVNYIVQLLRFSRFPAFRLSSILVNVWRICQDSRLTVTHLSAINVKILVLILSTWLL